MLQFKVLVPLEMANMSLELSLLVDARLPKIIGLYWEGRSAETSLQSSTIFL